LASWYYYGCLSPYHVVIAAVPFMPAIIAEDQEADAPSSDAFDTAESPNEAIIPEHQCEVGIGDADESPVAAAEAPAADKPLPSVDESKNSKT
jgi:hypothetical protein